MARLSAGTLGALPAEVARPAYDRAAALPGVVHLGIGAFHRAHQAVVFDDALAAGDMRWAVTAASLRSPDVRDALQPQDGLYTLLVRDGDREAARVIGAVREVIVAPEDPAALVAALAAPATHLVTLTVTEKGYRTDPATGALLTGDPDIAADLASLDRPRTAPGFIAAALARRRVAGLAPFTAISCDNLPRNGERLRGAVLAIAEAHDPSLARWIEAEGAFPATMVDRIVPATDPADIAGFAARYGVEDCALVKTEPFTQWAIEDRFAGPRPDFAALGVQLTADVVPWENAKLRLLNGAHSAIAYLGGLAGDDYVHQFVMRPEGQRYFERLWDETAATLTPVAGLDLPAYRRALMARFANAALMHRTRQIAMDGSQKLPQRLVASIAARARWGLASPALVLAVAGWMRWQAGITDAGERFAIDDPLADRLGARVGDAAALLALLGADLDPAPFAAALATLEKRGARAAMET